MDHIHTFLTTLGHGEPPRMSDHPNAGATSETAQIWKIIHTKHTLSHPNKANMEARMLPLAPQRWTNFHINCYNILIFILYILHHKNRKNAKFQFNWSNNFRDIDFNMKISKCFMHIRFWNKTFNFFPLKFQDMYNNFKYGFHDK